MIESILPVEYGDTTRYEVPSTMKDGLWLDVNETWVMVVRDERSSVNFVRCLLSPVTKGFAVEGGVL